MDNAMFCYQCEQTFLIDGCDGAKPGRNYYTEFDEKVPQDCAILTLACGIAVVMGHNWPMLLGFKGGKGIATTIGVALTIKPLIALVCISIGVAILYKYKYVSLASVVAISLFPFIMFIYGLNYFLFGLILALLAIYKHRENIKRLLDGNERKIGEKSSVK